MTPKRIVSVVPSQTELLFDLGLENELIGVTKFCIHPADRIKTKAIVGGTKTLDLDKIQALGPNFILANKEENTREQIEALQQKYPVHITDMATVSDAISMIREVGTLLSKHQEAETMAQQIESRLLPPLPPLGLSVAYLIWRKPYMAAASSTFIDAMLTVAGLRNAFADQSRYPVVTHDDLQKAQPDLIFLSSEPYPFTEKYIAELQTICPSARVLLVDGEVFSWYGSRLLRASDYFKNLRNEIARTNS
ncbi:helical backbone metal receptor [Spirosoma fluviale]|uniref:ABC-type Fe3+-hydroxamate transport system, substrate-binding protein n=1 Tax=Spirosoma fluviale TaxID=1597977 RepID=A0A286GT72_9BACT|nr:helical backbone metal receptor [Spirosoma fluviale]SOD98767.1 ABC-type Fe3+-hydroxamate transport system, substrate-binding protein [Spirosoma fluviale]